MIAILRSLIVSVLVALVCAVVLFLVQCALMGVNPVDFTPVDRDPGAAYNEIWRNRYEAERD